MPGIQRYAGRCGGPTLEGASDVLVKLATKGPDGSSNSAMIKDSTTDQKNYKCSRQRTWTRPCNRWPSGRTRCAVGHHPDKHGRAVIVAGGQRTGQFSGGSVQQPAGDVLHDQAEHTQRQGSQGRGGSGPLRLAAADRDQVIFGNDNPQRMSGQGFDLFKFGHHRNIHDDQDHPVICINTGAFFFIKGCF